MEFAVVAVVSYLLLRLVLLRLQTEYREKRRRYLTRFSDVPPDLYSPDLDDDFTCLLPSSSSSGDQDGASPSPGVVVTAVCRRDSASSGDAFADVRTSGASGSAEDGDEADGWSMKSFPGAGLVVGGDQEDDGHLKVDRRISFSASDSNLQALYSSLNEMDDTEAAAETTVLADVLRTPDVEELDLNTSDTKTIVRQPSIAVADGAESTGPETKSATTTPTDGTPTDDVEQDRRRSPLSPSPSPQHQTLSAAERRLVNEQLLLNNSALEAS